MCNTSWRSLGGGIHCRKKYLRSKFNTRTILHIRPGGDCEVSTAEKYLRSMRSIRKLQCIICPGAEWWGDTSHLLIRKYTSYFAPQPAPYNPRPGTLDCPLGRFWSPGRTSGNVPHPPKKQYSKTARALRT